MEGEFEGSAFKPENFSKAIRYICQQLHCETHGACSSSVPPNRSCTGASCVVPPLAAAASDNPGKCSAAAMRSASGRAQCVACASNSMSLQGYRAAACSCWEVSCLPLVHNGVSVLLPRRHKEHIWALGELPQTGSPALSEVRPASARPAGQ